MPFGTDRSPPKIKRLRGQSERQRLVTWQEGVRAPSELQNGYEISGSLEKNYSIKRKQNDARRSLYTSNYLNNLS